MTSAPSLRRNFSWTLVGNGIYGACQWAMLIVLAKLGDEHAVGSFALGFAIAGPVMALTNLQLRTVQATDAGEQFTFSDYLGLRLLTSTLAIAAVAVVIFIAGYDPGTAAVIGLVVIAKAAESISDILYGLLQQAERLDRVTLSLTLKGSTSVIALFVAMYVTRDIIAATAALAVAWTSVLLFYDVPMAAAVIQGRRAAGATRSSMRPRWIREDLSSLVRMSSPLGGASGIGALRANIPRYFVDATIGRAALAPFAAMAYIVVLGGRVVLSLGQAASARLGRHALRGEHDALQRVVFRLIATALVIGVAGVTVAIIGGRPLLSVLYTAEYATHLDVFVWIMVAGAFEYLNDVMQTVLTAGRWMRIQIVLAVVATLVVFLVSAIAIPRVGLVGAAWAMTAAVATEAVGSSVAAVFMLRGRRLASIDPDSQTP